MVKLLYDLDVSVIERSWPQGMQIGVSSAIGVDTFLVDEVHLERHFLVLIESSENNRRLLSLAGDWIESRTAGQFNQVKTKSLLKSASGRASALTAEEFKLVDQRLPVLVGKLRLLIDREKPAHSQYFLALETTSDPTVPRMTQPPFVIEQNSTIGNFLMN
jgi:hypothetical protein